MTVPCYERSDLADDRDQVLVRSETGWENPDRVFAWRNGTATDLTGLVPGGYVDAREINDSGVIAGTSGTNAACGVRRGSAV